MSKYVVTDPCYLLEDDVWSNCCNAATANGQEWNNEVFNAEVTKALKQMSGGNAWASETGFGDWSNCMHGDDSRIESVDFAADSGMVCVCEMTPAVEEVLKKKFPAGDVGLVSIIECIGEVSVEFDKSDENWTVVYVDDEHGCFNSLLPSDGEEK